MADLTVYNGAAFVSPTTIRVYDGAAFVNASAVHIYDGAAFVEVWGGDFVPDALNWGDINSSGGLSGISANQTVTGINRDIELKIEIVTGGAGNGLWIINGANASSNTETISNGDVTAILVTASSNTSGTGRVINLSDSNTVIDTFTYTIQSDPL